MLLTWRLSRKGKNVTKMSIDIMKAEVLRPARAPRVADIEEQINEWKVTQFTTSNDVGVSPKDVD